jgi:hypothetical protein
MTDASESHNTCLVWGVARLWMMCAWAVYAVGAPSLRFLQGRVAMLLAQRFVFRTKPLRTHVV